MMSDIGLRTNILLVDDDSNVREALGEALATENYEVAFAATVAEARRHLQEQTSADFHAVLLNVGLGQTGIWDLFHWLAVFKPQLPVITISAARDPKIPPAARSQSAAVMAKPLDLPKLMEILRTLTSASRCGPATRIQGSSTPVDQNSVSA